MNVPTLIATNFSLFLCVSNEYFVCSFNSSKSFVK